MKAIFLILFLAYFSFSKAQDSSDYVNPDTMLFYAHPIESFGDPATAYSFRSSKDTCRIVPEETDSKSPRYFANCKEINKEKFDSLNASKKNMKKCRPCVLNYFDDEGNVIQTSMQFGDCYVGDYLEYYPSGQIKVKGSWKKNYTGNWRRVWKRGYCSVIDGVWTYYSETGEVIKTETYQDGVLLE